MLGVFFAPAVTVKKLKMKIVFTPLTSFVVKPILLKKINKTTLTELIVRLHVQCYLFMSKKSVSGRMKFMIFSKFKQM